MDQRLIELYEIELKHLRTVAAKFGEDRRDIARRLNLKQDGLHNDPYVERLLEGFAFLTSRVQRKFESEFPVFTQGILETVAPQYVTPFPSCGIVETVVAPPLPGETHQLPAATGHKVDRGSRFRCAPLGETNTECLFETVEDLSLWPVQLTRAQYIGREIEGLRLPRELPATAALVLRLKTLGHGQLFHRLPIQSLPIYINGLGESDTAARLYEAVHAKNLGYFVGPVFRADPGAEPERFQFQRGAISSRGFGPGESLLPESGAFFQGYRLLREYFGFPHRFMFFELGRLSEALEKCPSPEIEIIIPLSGRDETLERRVTERDFRLFCVPVVNLFEMDTDLVPVNDTVREYHVVPDRTRPASYEVYQVLNVNGRATSPEGGREFKPFFYSPHGEKDGGAFFSVRREGVDESAPGSSTYLGSEVYVSLVDTQDAPHGEDLRQVGFTVRCTNRHFPGLLPRGERVAEGQPSWLRPVKALPCREVRFLTGPTDPKPAPTPGSLTWRIIAQLSLNFFSMAGLPSDGRPHDARVIRELLKVYADMDPMNEELSRRLDGVQSIRSRPVTRGLRTEEGEVFVRGIEIAIEVDPVAFEGTGVFLFGAILESFLTRMVSMNSFVETVLCTTKPDEREVMRWPPRTGTRYVI